MAEDTIKDDGVHFFFKCNSCQHNFMTKNYRIKFCVNCGTKNLKRLPQERMYICPFCFKISITKPMAESHSCSGLDFYLRGKESELMFTDDEGERIVVQKGVTRV